MELRTVGTLLALLLFGAETVDAQDRRIYGTRAFGMGGASVAVVQDATAVGVNPAAMGFLPATDFQFPVASVDAEIRGDILRVADDIADVISEVPILEIIDAMSNATTAEARQAARQLGLGLFLYDVSRLDSQGKGAKARGVTGPAYRFKNFGFALTGAIDATVGFELDLKSGLSLGNGGFDAVLPEDEIIAACLTGSFCGDFASTLVELARGLPHPLSATQAEQLVLDTDVNRLESDPRAQTMLRAIVESTARGDATLEENQSSGITAGLTFAELAFGYGRRIGQSAWSLGVTANLIFGTTYSSQVTVADFADTDFVEDMFDRDNVLSETRIGIDLGTIYRPSENWSFGLTGTSLNEPTFDLALGRESAFPSAGTHPGIDAEGRS